MTRVALIGANGHGVYHRRLMAPLVEAGTIDVVGMCDLAPIRDEPGAPVPRATGRFTSYREMLDATRPAVAIVSTPPHTHLEIAMAAVRAGADVLLEKPPFLSLAEHHAFGSALERSGRVCQVGFQSLGSSAATELFDTVRAGRLGRVTGIGAYGAWQRPDSYYARAPWAGRREMEGRPVLDGALVNPFAHAVMHGLAMAEACGPVAIASVEVERNRARPIEVDDTAVARVRLVSGPPIVVGGTLCADRPVEPRVIVHTESGDAVLEYTTNRLQLPGQGWPRTPPGQADLLANLLRHRAAPAEVPLLVAVERTAPFTAVVEAIVADGAPAPIEARLVERGTGAERVAVVPGVTEVMRRAADRLELPSELGIPWALRKSGHGQGHP